MITCSQSDLDLLTTLLDSPTMAATLLSDYGSLTRVLALDAELLRCMPGITATHAARLAAVSTLLKRAVATPVREVLRSPDAVATLMQTVIGHLPHEEVWAVVCNTAGELIYRTRIAQGDVSTCMVEPAAIFTPVVRLGERQVILVHNHPTGHVEPSPEDLRLTIDGIRAGRILGIELVDHLIIGSHAWRSLRETTYCWRAA